MGTEPASSPSSPPHAHASRHHVGALEPVGLPLDDLSSPAPTSDSRAPVTKPERAGPSLTERTATGFAFMAAQMIVTRLLGILGNLVLAWLLVPEDFGLIGMATSVVAFAQIVQSIGVREVLIRRQSSYKHLANAGFWIAVSSGLLCAIVIAACSPLAALLFKEPRVVGLLLVLAAAIPVSNASLVPEARLQIDLRFRWVAMLNMISAGGTVILTVVFAWLGFGAYSLVLPRLILAVVRTLLAWRIAGFTPRLSLQTRRWKYIIGDSLWVLLANLCMTVQLQADVIMLGRALAVRGKDTAAQELGLYTFASALSMQAVILLAFSLGQILLPALSKLQEDPARQADALLRALRVLAMLVIPTCLLQAAVAEPAVQLVFPAKWASAIGVLQVLSLGMALRFFGVPVAALFQAQGRFRAYFVMLLGFMIFFLAVVTPTVFLTQSIVATAIAVAAWAAVIEPLGLYFALKPTGRGAGEVLATFIPPLFIAATACAAGWWCAGLVPAHPGRLTHFWRILVTCAVAAPILIAGTRLFMRPSWDEAAQRLSPFLARFRNSNPAAA